MNHCISEAKHEKNFGSLNENLKNESFCPLTNTIRQIRVIISILLLFLLRANLLAQVISFFVISLGFFVWIIVNRPYDSSLDNVREICMEIAISLVHLISVGIGIFKDNFQYRLYLDFASFSGMILCILIEFIFVIISMIASIIELIKSKKEESNKPKSQSINHGKPLLYKKYKKEFAEKYPQKIQSKRKRHRKPNKSSKLRLRNPHYQNQNQGMRSENNVQDNLTLNNPFDNSSQGTFITFANNQANISGGEEMKESNFKKNENPYEKFDKNKEIENILAGIHPQQNFIPEIKVTKEIENENPKELTTSNQINQNLLNDKYGTNFRDDFRIKSNSIQLPSKSSQELLTEPQDNYIDKYNFQMQYQKDLFHPEAKEYGSLNYSQIQVKPINDLSNSPNNDIESKEGNEKPFIGYVRKNYVKNSEVELKDLNTTSKKYNLGNNTTFDHNPIPDSQIQNKYVARIIHQDIKNNQYSMENNSVKYYSPFDSKIDGIQKQGMDNVYNFQVTPISQVSLPNNFIPGKIVDNHINYSLYQSHSFLKKKFK